MRPRERTDRRATRRPGKLHLLPGLRWQGTLRILERRVVAHREPGERTYLVAFNAVDPGADPQERFVYDHAVLTAKQLRDWTGWEEP